MLKHDLNFPHLTYPPHPCRSLPLRFTIIELQLRDCFSNLLVYFAATMALTLANLEGEESFDASMLGQADEVVQERICDDELIVIKR